MGLTVISNKSVSIIICCVFKDYSSVLKPLHCFFIISAFITSGGSRNFFHQVPFGRFSVIFSKSYKVSTIFFIFCQTQGVPGNPQNTPGSATVYHISPPGDEVCERTYINIGLFGCSF
ncbi:hypothetical protein Hanom_Chr06g00504201 [Helianthus anomalus]